MLQLRSSLAYCVCFVVRMTNQARAEMKLDKFDGSAPAAAPASSTAWAAEPALFVSPRYTTGGGGGGGSAAPKGRSRSRTSMPGMSESASPKVDQVRPPLLSPKVDALASVGEDAASSSPRGRNGRFDGSSGSGAKTVSTAAGGRKGTARYSTSLPGSGSPR